MTGHGKIFNKSSFQTGIYTISNIPDNPNRIPGHESQKILVDIARSTS